MNLQVWIQSQCFVPFSSKVCVKKLPKNVNFLTTPTLNTKAQKEAFTLIPPRTRYFDKNSCKLRLETNQTKALSIFQKWKVQKIFYLFTCILPNYVPYEITKEFWKNSHFENMILRCQNTLFHQYCPSNSFYWM